MSKISARGAVKLAEAHLDVNANGLSYRIHWVLRSDGSVLQATSSPDAPTSYGRKRSGYKTIGRFNNITPSTEAFLAAFTRFVTRKGGYLDTIKTNTTNQGAQS